MDDPRKAVAIKYNKDKDRAPKVLAKGRNQVAQKIIDLAKENKIPVYPDKDLVQVLEALDLSFEIPPELYRAVAEVLFFIYSMNKKL